MSERDATVGPVEIAIIGFFENRFTGEIAPAIAELIDSGTVAILDLLFVTKDADGTVTVIELGELDDEEVAAAYRDLDGSAGGLLNDEDLERVGDLLAPNSSGLALVWENAWARPLVAAIARAGGVLLAHDRIDAATVNAVLDELDEPEA